MNIVIEPFTELYEKEVISLISTIQRDEFNISITPDDQPDLKNIPNY